MTGASGGIGHAIGRRLAAEGASVALTYSAHAEPARADSPTNSVTDSAHAMAVQADLRRAEAPAELLAAIEPRLGSIDVLVPAAGLGRQQTLEQVSVDDFDEMLAINLRAPFLLAQQTLPGMLAINLRAPFLLAQQTLPGMRARGFGRILFVSSIAAFTGGIVGPHYAASKAGLHGLTHFLAARVAGAGVTVNAIAPALITDTRMLPGEPEELRDAVPSAASDSPTRSRTWRSRCCGTAYLTNQVVSLDGGIYPR